MQTKGMKAARVHAYGGPEQIVIEDAPRPEAQPGQVVLRMKAAGVNPIDWKLRSGAYRQFMPVQFPWTPGIDSAGIVETIGAGVTNLKVGQAVYGIASSAYAEYVAAAAGDLYPKPEHLSFEQAAAVPVGALTAWQAVVEEAEVQPGQRVLVHGGAGGVGLYAVQLAKWKGAHVTATASAANAEYVRGLGADAVIDYGATRFEDVVKDMDAVIDTVGGELIARSLGVIRANGIFVTIAGQVDPEAGQARGVRATSARRADSAKLAQISELLEAKQLRSEVGRVFTLAEAGAAQALSQTGHGRGRIILTMLHKD